MRFPARKRSQSGVTLLVMTVILGMGILAYLLTALNTGARNEPIAIRNRNAEVLAQAKAALIGYVAKEVLDLGEDTPGRLPCPESSSAPGTTNEGTAASGSCTALAPIQKTVGRLPWRTLGIDKLVDAESEPLWYAVSPNWVTGGLTVINSGTAGQLTADGTTDVVAIIIAPGRPLNVSPTATQIAAGCQARQQTRNDRAHVTASANNLNYLDYLECENGSPTIDTTFGTSVVDNATNLVINDQMVVITAKELLSAMQGPLAERMQRTVAPLLSEYSTLWPSGTFLPYAYAMGTPEDGSILLSERCGPTASVPGQTPEGLLPIAPNSGGCLSDWTGFAISGSVTSLGCAASPLDATKTRCQFRYYVLNGLGQLIFGAGAGTTDATIQATAPHAAASFRKPLVNSDITIVSGSATVQSTTLNPQTDGDARMSLVVRVSGANLCDNTLLGVVCSLLGILLTTNSTVAVDFPQLGVPTLQGTKLSSGVAGCAPTCSINLLSPATSDPHYWFMQNEWYRYAYYAVSPSASAAAAGGNFTINGFPTANGANNDKRFVLALMGPSLTGQTRPNGTLSNYLEGDNAAKTASPRVFAWTVYGTAALPGNDRIATCPFTDGATPCN